MVARVCCNETQGNHGRLMMANVTLHGRQSSGAWTVPQVMTAAANARRFEHRTPTQCTAGARDDISSKPLLLLQMYHTRTHTHGTDMLNMALLFAMQFNSSATACQLCTPQNDSRNQALPAYSAYLPRSCMQACVLHNHVTFKRCTTPVAVARQSVSNTLLSDLMTVP